MDYHEKFERVRRALDNRSPEVHEKIASGKVEAAASLAAAIERQSDGQCRVAGYCHLCKESLEHGRRPPNTLATVLEWLLAELERHPDSAELLVNVEVSKP